MNIFATSDCPVESASWLDDKRLVKMILETGQLVSTVLRRYDVQDELLYKSAYHNHPCTLWAGATRGNFLWLIAHGLAMCSLYTQVYGRTHSTEPLLHKAYDLAGYVPDGDLEEFCDCTEFKHRKDLPIIERYRLFMILKWSDRDSRAATWSKRSRPYWYKPKGLTRLILKTKET